MSSSGREIRTDITFRCCPKRGRGQPCLLPQLVRAAPWRRKSLEAAEGVLGLQAAHNASLPHSRPSVDPSAPASPVLLKPDHEPPGGLLKHKLCTPRVSESVVLTSFQVAHAAGLQTTLRTRFSSLISPHLVPSRPVSSTIPRLSPPHACCP